ncbi:MAG: DivIVA domain-containing protein [Ignavibacteriae bacterium]|nr:DivIVA domain-containing protein [Ignavibacteria bacterium]MBI3364645.1 DivIVA domain-containing protein [Ignavibacteriota bacterium]
MKTLLPGDIKLKEFGKRLRGFNPDEVRAFLLEVASRWDEAERRRDELDRKVVELETVVKEFRTLEAAVRQTLLQTQETGGKAIEAARKEAQLIIQEAEMKAAHILEKARNDLTAVKEQVVILRAKKDSIVSRMKMLLNSEMEIIKALEVDEEFQRSNPETQQEFSQEKSEIDEIIRSLDKG